MWTIPAACDAGCAVLAAEALSATPWQRGANPARVCAAVQRQLRTAESCNGWNPPGAWHSKVQEPVHPALSIEDTLVVALSTTTLELLLRTGGLRVTVAHTQRKANMICKSLLASFLCWLHTACPWRHWR